VPVEENRDGSYWRPKDALDATDHDLVTIDGREITLHGSELDQRGTLRRCIYQAEILPGVGLTEWTKVARSRHGSWEEVRSD